MDLPKLCTTRLLDQNFGMCISPQDILLPFFCNNSTNYYRPWKLCEEIEKKDFGATIDNTKDKFKIALDVQHFRPEEISVKVNDKEIIIEGKHEEKEDDHGFISRQFVRRYVLPKDSLSESVTSTLSSDGILSITANKKACKEIKEVKTVPLQVTGPCRKTETASYCEGEMKKDMCDMRKDKYEIKKEQREINKDSYLMKNKATEIKDQSESKNDACVMMKNDQSYLNKDKGDQQKCGNTGEPILKEEHSRLLKPELLGEAVSGTEKLLSESRKETDELLRLMSTVQAMPNPTEEKLDLAIEQCKAAVKELKKDKAEINMSAMSEMESTISSGTISSTEKSSLNSRSTEMSSMKSSMVSEIVEMSMATSTKATSGKTCDIVSEIISAELKEAAADTL